MKRKKKAPHARPERVPAVEITIRTDLEECTLKFKEYVIATIDSKSGKFALPVTWRGGLKSAIEKALKRELIGGDQ